MTLEESSLKLESHRKWEKFIKWLVRSKIDYCWYLDNNDDEDNKKYDDDWDLEQFRITRISNYIYKREWERRGGGSNLVSSQDKLLG